MADSRMVEETSGEEGHSNLLLEMIKEVGKNVNVTPRVLGTRLGGNKKVKKGNQGDEGRVKMYKEEGAGFSGMVKGEGAGLGDAVKGEGVRRGQDTGDIDASYSYPLVDPRLEEAHENSTVVQCTGADRSIVQPLNVMNKPLYSKHLEDDERDDEQEANDRGAGQGNESDEDQDTIDPGARQDDERDDNQDTIEGDECDNEQDPIKPGARQDDEQDNDQNKIDQRGSDVYEGGGAGIVIRVKDKGAGRSEEAKRITRGVKANVGGEELNLYHNTGSSTTIIIPARYRESMGKVVAAKHYLRAPGLAGYMDTKEMFKTTLTTASGASTRTWVYVVAGARPEALLGDSDAEALGIASTNQEESPPKEETTRIVSRYKRPVLTEIKTKKGQDDEAGVRTKAETNIGDSKAMTNLGDSHQDRHRAGDKTKTETYNGDSKAMTNLNDSHQEGHRAGVMTKAKTDISDSKAGTNLGDSHQDGHRPGVMTKAENGIGNSKAMTNLGHSHQEGHRAGIMTKAENDIGDSEAMTNCNDSHQEGVMTKAETNIGDSKP